MWSRAVELAIIIDFSRLSSQKNIDGVLYWCHFITSITKSVGRSYTLLLFKSDLSFVSSFKPSSLARYFPIRWADEIERTPDLTKDFIYLSGSQTLTRKYLNHFDCIYIKPTTRPELLTIDFYYDHTWMMIKKEFLSEKTAELNVKNNVIPTTAASKVGVISSVFNGDAFLTGFLANAASWACYDECEHLLIRAGSSGNESSVLIEHVAHYPNAIYINLVNDPGLYAVWNLGIQLSGSPYLTNANIDDRRAPNQISRLTKYLDQHPDIDLVSANLYVTSMANQTWEDKTTKTLPVMFGSAPKKIYVVGEMFRSEGKGLSSRNFPHCMPLWRRQLHYTVGWFCEKSYGPSADWEFWLRVGMQGAQYAYLSEPLGLYLKHEASYWRRQETHDFDQRIVEEYALVARNAVLFDQHRFPLSQRVNETLSAYAAADVLALFCGLANCVLQLSKPKPTASEVNLIDCIARKILGVENFCAFSIQHNSVFLVSTHSIENALSLAIELLHSQRIKVMFPKVLQYLLESFFIGYSTLTDSSSSSVIALLGLAFLKRQQGNNKVEKKLLLAAYQQNPIECWASITRIYRFSVSLEELTSKLTSIVTVPTIQERKSASEALIIWFYPVVPSNKYQRLLYSESVIQGVKVTGITDLKQFSQLKPTPEHCNIIHIHWISEFVASNTEIFPQQKAEQFLQQLQQLKSIGFDIRWTIHNAVSHDAKYQDEEVRFRQALYQLVNRVYVHHPLALPLLEWLPNQSDKCALIEHGHYLSLCTSSLSREDARRQLGIAQDDFVVFYFGLLRDYKGLGQYLPVFEKISEAYPHVKFIIAGQIHSKKIKQMFNAVSCPNIIVHDKFLTDSELEIYSLAANIGFLSYRSILTSGTLFHMMSAKLPVIAPALGTIPAYIAKGWNGFLYQTPQDLEEVMRHCCQLPVEQVTTMGNNAYQLASSLKWRFF